MTKRSFKLVFGVLAAMCHCSLHAEDIDLFVNTSSTTAGDLPNVLFIIDNTANWSQAFENEKAALAAVFNSLGTNADGSAKFRIGVMFAAETSSADSNVQGGYVRAAIRDMTPGNKLKYSAMISALDVNKDKGNGGQSSLVISEAFRYFSGGAAYSGNNKAKADYAGNTAADWSASATSTASKVAMKAIYDLGNNALGSKSATNYVSPIGSGCGKNFIIYISNGPSQDSNSVVTQSKSMLSAAGGSTTTVPLSPSGSQDNVSDEWAYFMRQVSPLQVVTYTIEVNKTTTGQGLGWTALLQSMADKSEGLYQSVSSDTAGAIEAATRKALSQIQAVNTVFASVSLPVSVNTQGTYLNQVYVGMFRPNQNAYPRWAGNLKQYKLGYVGTSLELLDADEDAAINPNTGFITECARSFWTPTSKDYYWSFRPQGGCIPPSGEDDNFYNVSDFPDGNVVEKGAQGYVLRNSTARTLKTCSTTFSDCTNLSSLTTFNTSNISAADVGASTEDERQQLINWEIGQDVDNENTTDTISPSSNSSTAMRPSVHGDVVHSRPVAINFGTSTSPKVVVFYGGNDGVFRAVNGNRTDDIGTKVAGAELWAFIPPEFYDKIKRIRDNNTQINFPNITGGSPKPYGVDGAIVAYNNNGDEWIYATLRRGGRAIYAFKASLDSSSGALSMELVWKKGCPNVSNDTGCSTDFLGIGQTWSAPKIFKPSGVSYPVMLVGGGYDTCEDSDPNICTSSSKGRKIYVLNAESGAVVSSFTTSRSVIADVTLVPDSTGVVKYAYSADLGGNVYRIDTGAIVSGTWTASAPSAWTMTKVASLGCSTTSTCTANRKFMFAPDVVQNSGTNYIMLGSGDREKPLISYASAAGVQNYFFMIEDKPTSSTWLASENTNCGSAIICLGSLLGVTSTVNVDANGNPTGEGTTNTPSDTALSAKKGWYLQLESSEQVVTTAITIYGNVSFSTHKPYVPVAGACSSELGTTRVYNVSYLNASGGYDTLPPVGLPPSPVAGMVTLDDGTTVPFCIGCSSESPLDPDVPKAPPGTVSVQPKNRVYWYVEK